MAWRRPDLDSFDDHHEIQNAHPELTNRAAFGVWVRLGETSLATVHSPIWFGLTRRSMRTTCLLAVRVEDGPDWCRLPRLAARQHRFVGVKGGVAIVQRRDEGALLMPAGRC
jgi:hypothetical protein